MSLPSMKTMLLKFKIKASNNHLKNFEAPIHDDNDVLQMKHQKKTYRNNWKNMIRSCWLSSKKRDLLCLPLEDDTAVFKEIATDLVFLIKNRTIQRMMTLMLGKTILLKSVRWLLQIQQNNTKKTLIKTLSQIYSLHKVETSHICCVLSVLQILMKRLAVTIKKKKDISQHIVKM